MSEESSVLKIFQDIGSYFEDEQDKRENIKTKVQDLELALRPAIATLQGMHNNAQRENIESICAKVDNIVKDISAHHLRNVASMLPKGQYYRFNDHWRHSLQRIVFVVLLVHYLEHGRLLTKEETDKKLGLDEEWDNGFRLDIDDYLQGTLLMTNELARLSVNSVIAGDYERPFKIASFISEIDAAFRLLNLKNDSLRKRFDGLKYNLRKVEEVVYDLTVRGLKKSSKET